jgi:phage-related protein
LEIAGPLVGQKDVKKLKGQHGLREIRVNDPSGAYRVFFAFARLGKDRLVAVGYVARKTSDDFPSSTYEVARRCVLEFLDELGARLDER